MTYQFEDVEAPAKKSTGGRIRTATPFDDVVGTSAIGAAKRFVVAEDDAYEARKQLNSAARLHGRAVKIFVESLPDEKAAITFAIYQPKKREPKTAK